MVESFFDVTILLGAGLEELYTIAIRKFLAFLEGDL